MKIPSGMIRPFILILSCFLSLAPRAQNRLSFSQATTEPQLLPAWINTSASERDFAFSPNGDELFFTLQGPRGTFQTIIYSHLLPGGDWSPPVLAPFASRYSDLEPVFSADGKRLYFSSNRPLDGEQAKDFDIWMVEKTGGKWGEPVNLGSPVNTPADEFYPSIASNGNLYFTAAYKEGIGKEDIYLAKWSKDHFLNPEPLDRNVNSTTYEFNAFVLLDESLIIFTSYGRADDLGGGDLYYSLKDSLGNWTPARHLSKLSSNRLDYCPFISADRKTLFFTSERQDIIKLYERKETTYSQLIRELTGPYNGNGNIFFVKLDSAIGFYE